MKKVLGLGLVLTVQTWAWASYSDPGFAIGGTTYYPQAQPLLPWFER